nr:ribonuclease HI [Rhizobium sp. TCK]
MNTSSNRHVEIYTDGACIGNPGPGGWAAVLSSYECDRLLKRKEVVGFELDETTNNRMELKAALEALRHLKPRNERQVIVFSDSQYLVKGMTTWMKAWMKNGWRTSAKKPVENQDLWVELLALSDRHGVEWRWVRGHDGNDLNEWADSLANDQAETARLIRQTQSLPNAA